MRLPRSRVNLELLPQWHRLQLTKIRMRITIQADQNWGASHDEAFQVGTEQHDEPSDRHQTRPPLNRRSEDRSASPYERQATAVRSLAATNDFAKKIGLYGRQTQNIGQGMMRNERDSSPCSHGGQTAVGVQALPSPPVGPTQPAASDPRFRLQ